MGGLQTYGGVLGQRLWVRRTWLLLGAMQGRAIDSTMPIAFSKAIGPADWAVVRNGRLSTIVSKGSSLFAPDKRSPSSQLRQCSSLLSLLKARCISGSS